MENNGLSNLWKLFFTLINLMVFIIIIGFMSLVFQGPITDYLNQPSYTQDELDKFEKIRAKNRIQERNDNYDLVENGIHVKTGLKADKNLKVVIGACTSCHSAKLITQNSATRAGWKNMIVWMQETQGLVDLGDREPIILDYLAEYYAPKEVGRRKGLDIEEIEWYILEIE